MKYQKEVLLKDGTKCLLRGAGERDAAEILRCFHLTHAETDYLLTYPEENLFTVADEAKFLKASEESANAIEIGAFVNGKVVGSAGIEPLGDKEKLRHRADFGIAVEKAYWGKGNRQGADACVHRVCEAGGLFAAGAGGCCGERSGRSAARKRLGSGSTGATPEGSSPGAAGRSWC